MIVLFLHQPSFFPNCCSVIAWEASCLSFALSWGFWHQRDAAARLRRLRLSPVHCRLSLGASFRWRVLHSINFNIRLVCSWCPGSNLEVAKEERTIAMPITVAEPCIGKWTMSALSSVASFISMRGCSKRLPSSPWSWLSHSDGTCT